MYFILSLVMQLASANQDLNYNLYYGELLSNVVACNTDSDCCNKNPTICRLEN